MLIYSSSRNLTHGPEREKKKWPMARLKEELELAGEVYVHGCLRKHS